MPKFKIIDPYIIVKIYGQKPEKKKITVVQEPGGNPRPATKNMEVELTIREAYQMRKNVVPVDDQKASDWKAVLSEGIKPEDINPKNKEWIRKTKVKKQASKSKKVTKKGAKNKE